MFVIDRGLFIKQAVQNKDTSKTTVDKIKALLNDNDTMPITYAPMSALAIAALDVLGVTPYKGNSVHILYYKELFSLLVLCKE